MSIQTQLCPPERVQALSSLASSSIGAVASNNNLPAQGECFYALLGMYQEVFLMREVITSVEAITKRALLNHWPEDRLSGVQHCKTAADVLLPRINELHSRLNNSNDSELREGNQSTFSLGLVTLRLSHQCNAVKTVAEMALNVVTPSETIRRQLSYLYL